VAYGGDIDWSRREAITLSAMGEILGIRVRERVREQLGGAYAINAVARSMSLPDSEYLVYVIFGSDPDRVDELFAEVTAEIDWLQEGGDQEYLDTAKELLRTPREEDLERNSFWLSQILSVVQRGETFDAIHAFDDLLDALTLEDVVEAAKRYLTDERYIRVVLLPEEG
jgi:zinc protease